MTFEKRLCVRLIIRFIPVELTTAVVKFPEAMYTASITGITESMVLLTEESSLSTVSNTTLMLPNIAMALQREA